MQLLLVLDAKYLESHLTPADGELMVVAVLEAFLKACLIPARALERGHYGFDWDRYFSETAQESYLEVAIHGQVFNIVDHKTGQINTNSWYRRYMELMEVLNKYYRHDVIAAIRLIEQDCAITHMSFHSRNQATIQIIVHYKHLLTHQGATSCRPQNPIVAP